MMIWRFPPIVAPDFNYEGNVAGHVRRDQIVADYFG
jgi:hypothetical protein